jgi:hypothetical protein
MRIPRLTITVRDRHGDAHTAGFGELLSGLFAMDPKARAPSATTAATSMNETRNYLLGRKISSTTSGHNTKSNNIDRSGDQLEVVPKGPFLGSKVYLGSQLSRRPYPPFLNGGLSCGIFCRIIRSVAFWALHRVHHDSRLVK